MKRSSTIISKISGKYLITEYSDMNEGESEQITGCEKMMVEGKMPPPIRDLFVNAEMDTGIDGCISIRYNLSCVMSIYDAYREQRLNYNNIKALIDGIIKAAQTIEIYNCEEDGLELDPHYIFIRNERYRFCYRPVVKVRDIREEMLNLAGFVIRRCNHDERRAVDIAYGLYSYIHSGKYVLSNFCSLEVNAE